jgi:hypothetical protein
MSEPEQHAAPPPDPSPAEGERGKRIPRWVSNAPSGRVQPAWVRYFLRALERTGDVRASAEDAGIDHSTAYARRRAHPDFASDWEWVLKAHEEAKARAEEEEIAAVRAGLSPPLPNPSPAAGGGAAGDPSTAFGESDLSPPGRGEELIASNGQLKRAGPGRWNKAKERIFFEELAATANARRAAAAVGADQRPAIIALIAFPLTVNGAGRPKTYRDRASVERDFDRIFTPRVKRAILAQEADQLLVRDQGAMIGEGEVWFDRSCATVACSPPGPVRIRAVNP